MIDIHCHLLPGIDDGPSTLQESLELCRIAVADGITHAIVTPHIHPGRWENDSEIIARKLDALLSLSHEEQVPLHIGYAGEVRLTDQIMQQVDEGKIPYYGMVDGYQIMLLEFPHAHIIPGSEKIVDWLLRQNIRPVIAHPERNKRVMNDPASILPFVEAGCWLQVTAGSVLGDFGERARIVAEQLLRDDLVAVLASDGHNNKARQPQMSEAFRVVSAAYSESRARRLMIETPAKIVSRQFSGDGSVL